MMGKIVALIAVAVPCPWLCSVEDVEAQPPKPDSKRAGTNGP